MHPLRPARHIPLLAALLVLAGVASADIITLTNGKKVEGCVTAEDETSITIVTPAGEQQIPLADIHERVTGEELKKEYEVRARRTSSRTRFQLALAEWCKIHCLEEELELHARKVLERQPDSPKARELLGYTKSENGWVAPDGSIEPFAEDDDDDGGGRKPSTRGMRAQRPEVEFTMRWETVDKRDPVALRDLAYFCRSYRLNDQMTEVLRALFAINPEDEEGKRLARDIGVDLAVLRTKGLSKTTYLKLRDGKEILGKVVADSHGSVEMEIPEAGRFRFTRADILERKLLTVEEKEYFDRYLELSPGDLKGHEELAAWCQELGLFSYARKEAELIIGLDRNNEGARAILGHEKRNGQWVAVKDGQDADAVTEDTSDWRRHKKETEIRCRTLMQLIKTGAADTKVEAINEALAMRNPYVVEVLFHILEHERTDPAWITQAKEALHEIQNDEVVRELKELRDVEDPDLLNDCIDVLGKIKTEDSAMVLAMYLVKVDSRHHQAILDQLRYINTPTIDLAMRAALDNTGGPLKEQLISLCGELRAVGTIPSLLKMMLDRHPFLDHCHAALVRIGYPAVPALIESLKDRARRKQTVRVLREITGETLPISYSRWHDWWQEYSGSKN
jgi:hypothetical protein